MNDTIDPALTPRQVAAFEDGPSQFERPLVPAKVTLRIPYLKHADGSKAEIVLEDVSLAALADNGFVPQLALSRALDQRNEAQAELEKAKADRAHLAKRLANFTRVTPELLRHAEEGPAAESAKVAEGSGRVTHQEARDIADCLGLAEVPSCRLTQYVEQFEQVESQLRDLTAERDILTASLHLIAGTHDRETASPRQYAKQTLEAAERLRSQPSPTNSQAEVRERIANRQCPWFGVENQRYCTLGFNHVGECDYNKPSPAREPRPGEIDAHFAEDEVTDVMEPEPLIQRAWELCACGHQRADHSPIEAVCRFNSCGKCERFTPQPAQKAAFVIGQPVVFLGRDVGEVIGVMEPEPATVRVQFRSYKANCAPSALRAIEIDPEPADPAPAAEVPVTRDWNAKLRIAHTTTFNGLDMGSSSGSWTFAQLYDAVCELAKRKEGSK